MRNGGAAHKNQKRREFLEMGYHVSQSPFPSGRGRPQGGG